MEPLILLSLDVEEFDIPQEYGQTVAPADQITISSQGWMRVLDMLDRLDVSATFFITAYFARECPELVRRAAQRHQIASHGYYHSEFEDSHLALSRQVLQELSGQPVTAFRRARLAPTLNKSIAAAGYTCNSSENPIWLPGRYNNLRAPRTAYLADGLLQLPMSASPILRIPLFWLAFKNFPMWLIRSASARTLAHDQYLNLYFHPWEFVDIQSYGLPWFIRRRSGDAMLARMDKYLQFLKKHGRFARIDEFEQRWRSPQAKV